MRHADAERAGLSPLTNTEKTMNGLMMQQPLLISSLLIHAERHHGEQEVVSRRVEGDVHRNTYRELAARSRRMANALAALGVAPATASPRWPGTATATWSCTTRCRGSGAVLHTLNPRLHADQVVWIADHAEDQVLFFDLSFLPLVEAIAGAREDDQGLRRDDRPRAHAGGSAVPNLLCYEELVDGASDRLRLADVRREHRLVAVLHVGHHGQPEGRAVQPPLDACCTPTPRRCPMR